MFAERNDRELKDGSYVAIVSITQSVTSSQLKNQSARREAERVGALGSEKVPLVTCKVMKETQQRRLRGSALFQNDTK